MLARLDRYIGRGTARPIDRWVRDRGRVIIIADGRVRKSRVQSPTDQHESIDFPKHNQSGKCIYLMLILLIWRDTCVGMLIRARGTTVHAVCLFTRVPVAGTGTDACDVASRRRGWQHWLTGRVMQSVTSQSILTSCLHPSVHHNMAMHFYRFIIKIY